MDTTDQYQGALGFNQGSNGTSFAQSNAARQISDVQRQLALSQADLQQAGQQEREGINNGYEDRGLFTSGLRGISLAKQQGQEANKEAQLEAGAASDIGNINAGMQQQLASERAQQAQTLADQQLAQSQLGFQQQQISNQQSYAQQQLALQQQQAEMQRQLWQKQLDLAQQSATSNGG